MSQNDSFAGPSRTKVTPFPPPPSLPPLSLPCIPFPSSVTLLLHAECARFGCNGDAVPQAFDSSVARCDCESKLARCRAHVGQDGRAGA